jgi:chromosome condensin MukBEF MukE localization factor
LLLHIQLLLQLRLLSKILCFAFFFGIDFTNHNFLRDRRFIFVSTMTRGSQRERDRERAAARAGGKGKNGDDGLTPEQRRERDGKALQEKAAKKAAQAAGASSGGAAGGKGAAAKK